MTLVDQHNKEIAENLEHWDRKPLLKKIYRGFHETIARESVDIPDATTVELGSGIGNIKDVIPNCIRTDLFPNPWIDQVENAYKLSFEDNSVGNLVLFDVFHHLRYPGSAFREFNRVLMPGGRLILFEIYTASTLGSLVYGLFHHEPILAKDKIEWEAPEGWSADKIDYYAAAGNAARVFYRGKFEDKLDTWKLLKKKRMSTISYVASGGYSKPQLYPTFMLPCMRFWDKICNLAPILFATRLLVVLEKTEGGGSV